MLTFLGRGGAFNTKEGNTAAYYKENGKLLLVDCGESVFSKIQELDLLNGIEEVHVLITHQHSDHIGSLSTLAFYCYYLLNNPLTVWPATLEHEAIIKRILRDAGVVLTSDNIQDVQVRFNHLSNDIAKYFNELKGVSFYETSHVDTMKSYGILLDSSTRGKIYYSGDTNDIDLVRTMVLDHSIEQVFVDTTLLDYDGNVHLSLRVLNEQIPEEYRWKICCMHVNNDECIFETKRLGFDVVELNI
jgi:ribonuclease BN (tRNA processing enzyme)